MPSRTKCATPKALRCFGGNVSEDFGLYLHLHVDSQASAQQQIRYIPSHPKPCEETSTLLYQTQTEEFHGQRC